MTLPAPANQVVTFNFGDWIGLYPEFGTVSPAQAQAYFNQATTVCDNTPTSPIQDPFTLTTLLYLATAHIAQLFAMLNGQAPRSLVGRISNAAEGSVSVATVYTTPTTDLQAWWNQTSYGAMFWSSTTMFRTGFYVRPGYGQTFPISNPPPGGPWPWRW